MAAPSPLLDLVCYGEPMVEFAALAAAPDGGEAGPPHWQQGIGGDASNCAIAAARQGARTGVAGAIGADLFGDMLAAAWAAEGVDTGFMRRDPSAPTGLYFVTRGPAGHVFTYARAGSAASRLGPDAALLEAAAAARILHLSAISQAISASACDAGFALMAAARAAGALVSYDTNLRLRLWPLARARATILAAAAGADILISSIEDARQLTGEQEPEAIIARYGGLGPGIVALTLGPEGALVAGPDGLHRLPGHRVATVDATGAGDCFAGSFLARLAAGDAPSRAAEYANMAAALSTLGLGAVTPLPRSEAVLAALAGAAPPLRP